MAKFQNPIYHEDTKEKHSLTQEELAFLRELQKELNTQDTMCQADPRFWVIAGYKEVQTDEDNAENTIIIDNGSGEVAAETNLDSINQWLETQINPEYKKLMQANLKAVLEQNRIKIKEFRPDGRPSDGPETDWQHIQDLFDRLSYMGADSIENFQVCYLRQEHYVYPDTMFLTHKEAEDHLRAYGYNYDKNAHAYAMTAHRSPAVEKLWKILQTVNWE